MADQRSRRSGSSDIGLRGRRLEGLFREELNSLLDGEVGDPCLASAVVSRVELSRDGSSARVWFVTSCRLATRSPMSPDKAAFEPMNEPERVLGAWLRTQRAAERDERPFWFVTACEAARFHSLPTWFRERFDAFTPNAGKKS